MRLESLESEGCVSDLTMLGDILVGVGWLIDCVWLMTLSARLCVSDAGAKGPVL